MIRSFLQIVHSWLDFWQHLLELPAWQRKVDKKLSDLTQAEKDVEDSEAALEARVIAHETKDQEVADALQKLDDDLTAKLGAQDASVVALKALKTKLDAFDSAAPTSVTP